jgi:hypothetical protein
MVNLPTGNREVAPKDLMNIPVGSVILVGRKLDENSHWEDSPGSVWFVFSKGKAEVIDNHFPNSETEDLDWFVPWQVIIVGFNAEYAASYEKYVSIRPKPRPPRSLRTRTERSVPPSIDRTRPKPGPGLRSV